MCEAGTTKTSGDAAISGPSGAFGDRAEETYPQAAREFGTSAKTLANCVYKAQHDEGVKPPKSPRPPTDVEAEVSPLKRE